MGIACARFGPRPHRIANGKGGNAMRYAVIGGDVRFAHLVCMLDESGREAAGFLQDRAGGGAPPLKELRGFDVLISNWPMRWPLSDVETCAEEILENMAPGSVLLLCGPKFPQDRRWDLQYVNLWEEERLLQENAYLTAEAALALAMRRAKGSVARLPCAVVGYGRIGRSLTEILLNLGAQVAVLSRTEVKRRQARESGAEAIELERAAEVLPGKKLIFTTPPAQVLDAATLDAVDAGAELIDLASPPYGFDLDAARARGLHATREPGLPGRYCPLSAARALYGAVIRWEEAETNVR